MAACFQWAFVTKGLRTMGTDDAASCVRGGQRVAQGAGDDAGAGSRLQRDGRRVGSNPLRNVRSIACENDRSHAAVVVLWDIATEICQISAHYRPHINHRRGASGQGPAAWRVLWRIVLRLSYPENRG
jgi:hypothetical protein